MLRTSSQMRRDLLGCLLLHKEAPLYFSIGFGIAHMHFVFGFSVSESFIGPTFKAEMCLPFRVSSGHRWDLTSGSLGWLDLSQWAESRFNNKPDQDRHAIKQLRCGGGGSCYTF